MSVRSILLGLTSRGLACFVRLRFSSARLRTVGLVAGSCLLIHHGDHSLAYAALSWPSLLVFNLFSRSCCCLSMLFMALKSAFMAFCWRIVEMICGRCCLGDVNENIINVLIELFGWR